MTESQKTRRILDRLRVPPVKWQEVFDALPVESREDYARELEAVAEAAARMAGYFGRRHLGGDHTAAVKRSNTAAAAIRRALGFSYPRQDINF